MRFGTIFAIFVQKIKPMSNYKIENGKKITAAVVIINSDGDILGCHTTGKPQDGGYDFPKGCVEDNESDVEGAIRECFEETGIKVNKENLLDCGIHPHNKEKNIHIFLYKTETIPLFGLACTSYFENKVGKITPEVDGYLIVPKERRCVFNKVLWNKFEIIDFFNKG